jgi:hypothetical protein
MHSRIAKKELVSKVAALVSLFDCRKRKLIMHANDDGAGVVAKPVLSCK